MRLDMYLPMLQPENPYYLPPEVSSVALSLFKEKKPPKSATAQYSLFEKMFTKRLGLDPTTYIIEKLRSKSDVDSVHYLFDIIAAEITQQTRYKNPGFEHYYQKAVTQLSTEKTDTAVNPPCSSPQKVPVPPNQNKMTKSFAFSQLIGGQRFLQQYANELNKLASNPDFASFIKILHTQLNGKEMHDTKRANHEIAAYFFSNHANERFAEVQAIVDAVLQYGKQASAHISIYYSMFLLERQK